ncbi:phosphotransferase family protein [Nocardioides sp. T2.26MG-1]|uniref:phosphotransferase family protein n=1 Tax=Nocardioides sp. T2.26MG-1 TaxID=3041166 RepID=UPI0025425661|nr:aminoglycoside phosphotransferase family protein [Nocardioides sp. T2.26MG-1]
MDARVLRMTAQRMGWGEWDRWEPLAGGRGEVALAWKGPSSYVVKAYAAGRSAGGARERAALVVLEGAGVPRLLAESDDPACVVMTRLDGTESLADVLLAERTERARFGVLGWADALAAIHDASTPERCAAFVGALHERDPGLEPRALAGDFAEAADRYSSVLDDLGLRGRDEALTELRSLPAVLGARGHEVLTPADTCPDNTLLVGDAVSLIDFEFAQLRHAAWDVAYLQAPWPSCWCAWPVPDELADAAVERYCGARGDLMADAAFREDLRLAVLGWQVMSPAFFIAGALLDDDRGIDPRRPARRAFVLHRLGRAAAGPGPDALVELAGDLHDALLDRWGPVPLALAPAFRVAMTEETSRTVGP